MHVHLAARSLTRTAAHLRTEVLALRYQLHVLEVAGAHAQPVTGTRNEHLLERRETGLQAPSGKTRVEFTYRLTAGS